MLLSPLQHLAAALDFHLRCRLALSEAVVVAAPPRELDGGVPAGIGNKLIVFLADISIEPQRKALPSALRQPQGGSAEFLMVCAASFVAANYADGIKLLTVAMDFLEQNPVFTQDAPPGVATPVLPVAETQPLHQGKPPQLDPGIARVSVEPAALSLSESQALWSLHGGSYLPSMVYRVRVTAAEPALTP